MGVITTAQYTITSLNDGVRGGDAVVGVLDNDSHVIPTAFNGEKGNYAGANSTLLIFKGATDDTLNWKITITPGTGITGTIEGATYTVLGMTADTGSVEFLAEKAGSSDVKKTFTLSKSKQGESATTYSLLLDFSTVKRDELTGTLDPNSLLLTGQSTYGSEEPANYKGYFIVYEQSREALTVDEYSALAYSSQLEEEKEYVLSELPYPYVERYVSSTSEGLLNYQIQSDAKGIRIEWYKDLELTQLLDRQTIPVVSDGMTSFIHIAYATNALGTIGFSPTYTESKRYMGQYQSFYSTPSENPGDYTWILVKGDDATTAVLDNDVHVIPTNSSGAEGNYFGASSSLIILKGMVDDTLNWKITTTASTGVTGSRVGAKYTITKLADTTDSGEVYFVAEKDGNPTIRKTFSVTKSKQGGVGQDAIAYSISTNVSHIQKDELASTLDPSTLIVNGYSKSGSGDLVDFSGYFVISETRKAITTDAFTQLELDGRVTEGKEYIVSDTPYPYTNSYIYPTAEKQISYAVQSNATSVKIEWYKDKALTQLLDRQTIPVVSDGLTSFIHIKYSNDGGTSFTAVSGTTVGSWIGVYTDFVEKDSISPSMYMWNKVLGEASTSFSLTTSPTIIRKSAEGVISPTQIVATANSQTGTEARTDYKGRFTIEEDTGSGFMKVYTSSVDEDTKTYAVNTAALQTRVKLYLSGGTNTLLAEQTVATVTDGSDGMVLIINTPKGTTIRNGDGTLTAVGKVYKGSKEVSGSTYQWYELSPDGSGDTDSGPGWNKLTTIFNREITGYFTNTLTIPANAIQDTATYMVIVTYSGVKYKQQVTVDDITDPYDVRVLGSEFFKNAQGTNTYVAKIYQSGDEIDKDGSLYKYSWNVYNSSGTLSGSFNKVGKTITVNASEYDGTGDLRCTVSD